MPQPEASTSTPLRSLYGPTLHEEHARMLLDSAISPEVARARGYSTAKTQAQLHRHGFSRAQARIPGLLIPVYRPNREFAYHQYRPDSPRLVPSDDPDKPPKPVKYETPPKTQLALDLPTPAQKWIRDPKVPLWITEGARKADALVSAAVCGLSVPGVWGWRGTGEMGGLTTLPDWEDVALKGRTGGREVFLVFDSDVTRKRQVYDALKRFRAWLINRGADVWVVYLPTDPETAQKTGVDDYLHDGHDIGELHGLAQRTLLPPPDAEHHRSIPYRSGKHGLEQRKLTRDGEVVVDLTNFHAVIISQVSEHDGVEERRLYELEAGLNGHPQRFLMTPDVFKTMDWPLNQLGAQAIVYAGQGIRDHARVAIQELSGEIVDRTRYTHLGWRKVGDEWLYLHAGGAIGARGAVEHVDVAVGEPLDAYVLPAPPADGSDELREAVRASLRMLEVAPDAITCPVYAAIWRAAVGPCDFALYLWGETGWGKSQVAALAQQHYGPSMDAENLPANWMSTGNALEGIAFGAKDALLVVDDFAPSGTARDIETVYRQAERLFRAQGNRQGRQRMRADSSIRPTKRPRGMILSTGEDSQRHSSIRARLFELEFHQDDVRFDRAGHTGQLTAAQTDASSGRYAETMAAFTRWLAPRYEWALQELPIKTAEWRRKAALSEMHRRTPGVVAQLAFGIHIFCLFAEDAGALDHDQAQQLEQRVWKALGAAAAQQAEESLATEPARRFVDLIRAAISSGTAHLAAAMDGGAPTLPIAFGWRKYTSQQGFADWRPSGQRVGFVDEDETGLNVYLDPDSAYAVAQKMATNEGYSLPVSPRTLSKQLAVRGILASREREHPAVKRVCASIRMRVWHVTAALLGVDSVENNGANGANGAQTTDFSSEAISELPWSAPLEAADTAETGRANGAQTGLKGGVRPGSSPDRALFTPPDPSKVALSPTDSAEPAPRSRPVSRPVSEDAADPDLNSKEGVAPRSPRSPRSFSQNAQAGVESLSEGGDTVQERGPRGATDDDMEAV